jgi:hypothetical protein
MPEADTPIVCCCQFNRPVACRECLQADFDPNPINLDPDREAEALADFRAAQSPRAVASSFSLSAAVAVAT